MLGGGNVEQGCVGTLAHTAWAGTVLLYAMNTRLVDCYNIAVKLNGLAILSCI